MKRSTIVWLIIGVCLVVIGGVIFCLSMMTFNWNFTKLDNAKFETKTIEISDTFRNISIDTTIDDITFVPSEDGKCRIVFYEMEGLRHNAEAVNDTLMITSEDTRKWHMNLFSFSDPKATVSLPAKDYSSLIINESTGNIDIPADFSFGSIEINASTGNVTCRSSASGKILINLSTGNILAENISAGSIDLSVSTGSVNVYSADCAGNLSVSVTTGRSELKDIVCAGFSSTGSTGDLMLHNVTAAKSFNIERSTGDVTFDKCDAPEIAITTDTGDVSGTLLSDKVFIVSTDTGSIDVPKTTAGGKCEITTDTGDVKITIEK